MRMHPFFICLLAFVLMLSSFPSLVSAQDVDSKSQGGADQQLEREELIKAQTEALNERVKNALQGLERAESAHFMMIYTNYTIYSMVKAVREDVGQAVEACSKNNPKMDEALNNRFSVWEESVGGKMEEAYGNINAMSLAQDYISQNELKLIFALVDKTRAVDSSQFEKTPVTTPEACRFMMSKMTETQKSMNSFLTSTLQSYPNMMKRMQR